MDVCKAAMTGLLLLAVSSCAGGGSSAPVALPLVAGGGSITTTASTIALPTAGGFSGSMTFPATVAATSITVTSSTTPASTARFKQSGTLSRFFYVTMAPTVTMTLAALPSFTLSIPSTYATSGKQFYYALQVPAPAGVDRQFRTEGPGSLSGHQVFFGASLQPYTIVAGQKYTFEFYADSNGATVNDLLYALNSEYPNVDSITAYLQTQSGNTAPVRTLSGSNTQLSLPRLLAADADGDLVFANVVNDQESRIYLFPEGANGNARPVQLFSVPGLVTNIALDPTNGTIDAVYGPNDANYRIGIYAPTGMLLRTIIPINFSGGAGYQINGLAVDIRGNLIVSGYTTAAFPNSCAIDVFAPTAGPATPPAYVITPPGGLGCAALAYARSVDHLFLISGLETTIFELQNNASGTLVREFSSPQLPYLDSIAVDATGSAIFAGSSGADEIIPLVPSGSTFTAGAYLAGPATRLSPRALVVAPP